MKTKEQKIDYGKKHSHVSIAPSINHRYYAYLREAPLKKTSHDKKSALSAEKRNDMAIFLFPVVFLFALSAFVFRLTWYLIFVAGIPIIASLWVQSYLETAYKFAGGLSFIFSTGVGFLLFILLKKIVGNCELEEYYASYQTAISRKMMEVKKQYRSFVANS